MRPLLRAVRFWVVLGLLALLSSSQVVIGADPPLPSAEKKYAVEFRDKPWSSVLEWLSDQTGLPVINSYKLPGTFTFARPKVGKEVKEYSLGEVIDILNEGLLQQEHVLMRRDSRFVVIRTDEKPELKSWPQVTLVELEKRGRTELVSVTVPLQTLKAEDLAKEVKKLLGPMGEVVPLPKTNSLILYDSAGSVRRVLRILESMEEKLAGNSSDKRITFQMQHVPWRRVMEWLSDQTDMPVLAASHPQGTFSFISPKHGNEPVTYTIGEIIDLLNEELLVQKYLLIRRTAVLQLVESSQKIDPSLVPLVEVSELATRGRTELVSVVLPLQTFGSAAAVKELPKLMGPFGEVILLATAKRVVLRDTAGNLRRICKIVGEAPRFPSSQPLINPNPGKEPPAEGSKKDKIEMSEDVKRLSYVRFSEVTQTSQRDEAFLHDRYTDHKVRLRTTSAYNTFQIMDEEGNVLIRGKVLRIENRDFIFQADEKVYRIHIGESLADALAKPLGADELKKLGLTPRK